LDFLIGVLRRRFVWRSSSTIRRRRDRTPSVAIEFAAAVGAQI